MMAAMGRSVNHLVIRVSHETILIHAIIQSCTIPAATRSRPHVHKLITGGWTVKDLRSFLHRPIGCAASRRLSVYTSDQAIRELGHATVLA